MKKPREIESELTKLGITAEVVENYVIKSRSGDHIGMRLKFPYGFTLRFHDMQKLSDLIGTEHLNFGYDEGIPGGWLSDITWEEGTPGYMYIDAWD